MWTNIPSFMEQSFWDKKETCKPTKGVGWTLNDFGVMNCEITLLKAWGKDSFVCLILNQKG